MDELDLGATLRGFSPGQAIFQRYTLKKILGRGGMGVVWLARDEELGRDTALKFLPEIVTHDRAAIEDLKREVRRAIDLAHPHIVKVHDFVTDGRTAAVSMEHVDGATLSSLRLDEPGQVFSVEKLGPWVAQLAAALDYAHHEARVVHRDLKPANLMIDGRGRLKVLDFGVAATLSDSVTRVSRTAGASSGTPVYMSPQQMLGEDAAVTDDVYALGAALYELLAGKPPFHSGNIVLQVQGKVPPPVTERRRSHAAGAAPVPAAWEATIAACLAKDPSARPQSAGEVAERLGLGAAHPAGRKAPAAEAPRVERVVPNALSASPATTLPDSRTDALGTTRATSKASLYAGLTVAVLVLGGLGYYFWVHAPEQRKIELARLEAQRKEAERLATARGGLIVRTEPSGAEVSVGGVGIEKSPFTFKELRLGNYEVTVAKSGYESQTLKLTVEENRFTEPPAVVLKPSTGALALTSEPAGLDYELTSTALVAKEQPAVRRAGKTPADLTGLPVGEYALAFRREGWPEKSATVKIERGGTTRQMADFVGGALAVTSIPEGLEYEVQPVRGVVSGPKFARMTGKTPAALADLPMGEYAVTIRRPQWADESFRVQVERGGKAAASGSFAGGTLRMTSEPGGVDWRIKSAPTRARLAAASGRTPAELKDVPPGRYAVELQRSGGWSAEERTVEVKAGDSVVAGAEFPFGGLEVTSEPSGAEVFAEGKRVGVTPLRYGDLKPGSFDYELRLQGYESASVRGAVKAKETVRANVVLEKEKYYRIESLSLEMRWIAPGRFAMGSENGESYERPVTTVTITKGYWLGATEVTQGQWEAVMGSNPSRFKGATLPVEQVSWTEAMEFCQKLTQRERAAGRLPAGYEYTLPSEAQWEYACRAGTTGDYAGSLAAMGWYGDNSGGKTQPVATKNANAWGLYDMHGNVWEWCMDWDADKLPGGSVSDPSGPASGTSRVFRGGGWSGYATYCRSARRDRFGPGERRYYLGFRLALSSVR